MSSDCLANEAKAQAQDKPDTFESLSALPASRERGNWMQLTTKDRFLYISTDKYISTAHSRDSKCHANFPILNFVPFPRREKSAR